MKLTTAFVLGIFFISTLSPSVVQAATVAERLERLNGHVSEVRAERSDMRTIGGIVWIASGVGLGIYGAAGTAVTNRPVFYVGGGVLVAGGVLMLMNKFSWEKVAEDYLTLPQKGPEDTLYKVHRGEFILESMANTAREGRHMSMFMGIGFGALFIAGASSYSGTSAYDVSIYGGAALIAMGVVSYFIRTKEEKVWDEYQGWKAGKKEAYFGQESRIRIGFAPMPSGGISGALQIGI
jgi:hypothetical protein